MPETFGLTTKGIFQLHFTADRFSATKFQSGSAGSLASISAYLKYYSQSAPVKCAIYDSNRDFVLNGSTEELSCESGQDAFMEFSFEGTKPIVAATSDYWLCLWCDEVITSYYDTGAAGQWETKVVTYGAWPATLPGDPSTDRKFSIYATYEEAPTYIPKMIMIQSLILLPSLAEILKFAGS